MDLRLKNIDYQLTANVKGGVMDTTKIVRHTPPPSSKLSSVCSVACAVLDVLSCIYSVNYSFIEGIVL